MNALEKYYKVLDDSSYDCKDANTIDVELQQVRNLLDEKGDHELAATAELDRQVFSVNKSFDIKLDPEKGTLNGLSWKFGGNQTLEDGSEVPLYWPDVTSYSPQAFDYFFKRFKECKNLFAKTEYGLMVYFGEKPIIAKHNNFKKELFDELFQLSKNYYDKANLGGENNFYSQYFFHTLQLAFKIAEKAKLQPELSDIIQYVFEIHQNWDITKTGTLRILLDLSGLMSDFYGIFKKQIDFQLVLDKNLHGAKELEKTNIWGSMYAVDTNIIIEQQRNNPALGLLTYKAELYEKLAVNAEKSSNIACVGFAEKALRIYQQLDDSENITRLETMYVSLRSKFPLSEIRQDFPKEYIDEMIQRIQQTVADNSERGIIQYFIETPWYDSIQNIKERSVELSEKFVLSSLFPTSVTDKFGNTIDRFTSDDEIKEFNFWQSFSFNYQVGTGTMQTLFMEAYKADKLNYKSIIDYLENTWFNEIIERKYNGQTVEIRPIDTLKPGLKRLFEELDHSFDDNKHQYDFVTVVDSLTLKVEGLLRYLCEKLGIATFKTRQKGSEKLVMEKLLDDLLVDIAHKPPLKPNQITNFDEKDRMFIKFVMTEKVGLNLRNRVAHSMMDIFEYSFEHVVVLFCIIMKLSKYKFIEKNGDLIS